MNVHLNPELLELLEHFRLDRTYVRGKGSWLEDDRGRRVLDLSAQYGALPFGHNPDAIWEALLAVRREGTPAMVQPSRPVHALALAERLARLAPVGPGDGIVTFSQSGAEAVEVAIRLARLATGRAIVVGTERGYHGKTLGAASLTWESSRAMKPELRPPGFAHVPWDDAPALEQFLEEHEGEVAAVLLEPLQGEGGVREPGPDYFPRVRELCTRHGALLLLDEVQTGLGRLGTLFGCEQLGVRPDVLVLSKALGGGLVPLAATIAARAAWTEEFALSHGSTFANNNLACAAGLAVLDALEDGTLLEQARARGTELRRGLEELGRRYPGVLRELRGRGLLLGLELEPVGPESSYFMKHVCEHDAWNALVASYLLNEHDVRVIPCLTHGGALRVQPPLDVTPGEITLGLEAFAALFETIHRRDWASLVAPLLEGGRTGLRPRCARDLERPVQASSPVVAGEEPARFAFLIHHTAPSDLVGTTRAFERLSPEKVRALYDWAARRPGHTPLCFMPSIRGAGGAVTQGWLVGITHTPESMRSRPREEVSAGIGEAVRAAQRLGANVVGLGAFTSILTRNGAEAPEGSAITTGSALTVASAVDGVALACRGLGVDPRRQRGLVLGLGVVGSAAAVALSELLPSLVLVGNPERPERERSKARALADRIYARAARALPDPGAGGVAGELRRRLSRLESRLAARLAAVARGEDDGAGLSDEIAAAYRLLGLRPPVESASRLETVIREASVIVAATSAARPLIGPAADRPGL